jgi:endoglucanase
MPTSFGVPGVFDWGNVQGLGTVTLALVPNGLGWKAMSMAQQNIITSAKKLHRKKEQDGYLTPLSYAGGYTWGSNSFIANMCIVFAYAYDFSRNRTYLNDVTESMDYLLGRNAMDKSYVSGYGERPLENPHHRFWAHQANSDYPTVPPGVLSGGPNSALQDDFARSVLDPVNTPAQKCYVDNIESWSTNEITINWNAPLAWVTAYIDEQYNYQHSHHKRFYCKRFTQWQRFYR